jgi:RNA polymerase sigma factor (sigma-70 family)
VRGWRCGASAAARSFAPGCSRSWPTRRATACATAGAARAWRSARPPASQAPGEGDGRLRDALATLPERDRSVLACRFVLDLSEQETAGVLDIPLGTVKSRTARALERLRGTLEIEA